VTLHDLTVEGMFDAVGEPEPGHLQELVAPLLVCNWYFVIALSDRGADHRTVWVRFDTPPVMDTRAGGPADVSATTPDQGPSPSSSVARTR